MPLRAAALLVAVPVALAACGGGGGGEGTSTEQAQTPAASVTQAAHKTSAAASQHMRLKGAVTVNGQPIVVSGDGNFAKKNGDFKLDFNAGGLGGQIDAVLSDGMLYVRSPLFTTTLPQGKTWLKLDLSKVAASRGLNLPALAAQSPARTLTVLSQLRGVRELGTETLNGTDTTHYRGRLPATAGQGVSGPYDVWVGDDGYIHRIQHAASSGSSVKVVTTMYLSDFGKTVNITVPSASQTMEANTLTIPGLGG